MVGWLTKSPGVYRAGGIFRHWLHKVQAGARLCMIFHSDREDLFVVVGAVQRDNQLLISGRVVKFGTAAGNLHLLDIQLNGIQRNSSEGIVERFKGSVGGAANGLLLKVERDLQFHMADR